MAALSGTGMRRLGLLAVLALAVGFGSAAGPAVAAGSGHKVLTSQTPTAATSTLIVERMTPAYAHGFGTAPVSARTSRVDVVRAMQTAVAALPTPGPCATGPAQSCVFYCPFDSGVQYEVTLSSDAETLLTALLDPEGCEFATLQPGGTRLATAKSPVWSVIAAVLGVSPCEVEHPVVGDVVCKRTTQPGS